MLQDDEVQRVSGDALWLVGEAGRLLLQQLAVKGAAAAAAKKRKTIKLEDFEHVVRCAVC
jgi:histone H3/H4